jgi:GNAT superfamily N-acetyltransferase
VQYTLETVRVSQLGDAAAFPGATRSSSSGCRRDTTSPWESAESSATTRTSTPEHGLWIVDADGEVLAAALRTPPRNATEADRALLVHWLDAFGEEALAGVEAPAQDAERGGDARLDDARGFVVWEDERPVSLASWGGRTPNGARIGPVYTPPEHRRRGYGSAVTAAVSAAELAAGPHFCFLYTDLANPTPHMIYADIGHEPFCDPFDYAFEDE